jgi:hypothetical protein
MTPVASARLADLLRVQRYHEASAEQSMIAAELTPVQFTDAHTEAAAQEFSKAVHALLLHGDSTSSDSIARLDACLSEMENRYQDFKASLLASGAAARLPLAEMERALRHSSALRRAAQQLHKSRWRYLKMEAAERSDHANSDSFPT